jgi:hypothetical protein
MENLNIPPTGNTPQIAFEAESGRLLLKGRSIPEDPGEFYERILRWLDEYYSQYDQETQLEFQVEYANSGSTKYILEVLKTVLRHHNNGKPTRVVWCYEEDDESIEELGELYRSSVKLPWEMKEIMEEEDEEEL